MATFISNRDGDGKTDEKGHYKFQTNTYVGNTLQEDSFLVTQFTSPNLSVLVNSGDIRIVYTDYAYTGWNDSPTQLSIDNPDSLNPRIDRVVAYVDRSVISAEDDINNPEALKLLVVKGEPYAIPERPTDSVINEAVSNNPWCDLADVYVNTGATQITNDNITDTRVKVGLAVQVGTDNYEDGSITLEKQNKTILSYEPNVGYDYAQKCYTTVPSIPNYRILRYNVPSVSGVQNIFSLGNSTQHAIYGQFLWGMAGGTTNVIYMTCPKDGLYAISASIRHLSSGNVNNMSAHVTSFKVNSSLNISASTFRSYGLDGMWGSNTGDPQNIYTKVYAKQGDRLGIHGYVGGSTETSYSFQLLEWYGDL